MFPASGVKGAKDAAAGRAYGRLQVIDVSNIEKPKSVAWYEPEYGGVHNVWVAGDTLYMGAYNAGFRAFDISGELRGDLRAQEREMVHVHTADMDGNVAERADTWGVVVRDGLAYVNDINNGLWIVRIEPKKPMWYRSRHRASRRRRDRWHPGALGLLADAGSSCAGCAALASRRRAGARAATTSSSSRPRRSTASRSSASGRRAVAKVERTTTVGINPRSPTARTASRCRPTASHYYVTTAHGMPYGYLWKFDATHERRSSGRVELGNFPATLQVSPDGGSSTS